MARPRKVPNQKPTKERVLIAARKHFASAGYAHANLADIANDVGITRPSLLYHFDSKEALYRAVVGSALEALGVNLIGQTTVVGTFEQRMLSVTQAYFDFIDEHPWFAALILRDLIDGMGPVREFLMQQGAGIIDAIELWVQAEGAQSLPPNLNVRGALLQVVSYALVRQAAPKALRERLWGSDEDPLQYTRLMFFGGSN